MSQRRRAHSSPGRAPVRRWSSTMAQTWGLTWCSIAVMCSARTGRTRPVSLAWLRPLRSPSTVVSAWWVSAATSSWDAPHLNIRRSMPTSLFTYLRDMPSFTQTSRTVRSAFGPKPIAVRHVLGDMLVVGSLRFGFAVGPEVEHAPAEAHVPSARRLVEAELRKAAGGKFRRHRCSPFRRQTCNYTFRDARSGAAPRRAGHRQVPYIQRLKSWRRHPDSNREYAALQAAALPIWLCRPRGEGHLY